MLGLIVGLFLVEKSIAFFNICMGFCLFWVILDIILKKTIQVNWTYFCCFACLFLFFFINSLLNFTDIKDFFTINKKLILWMIIPFIVLYEGFNDKKMIFTYIYTFVVCVCMIELGSLYVHFQNEHYFSASFFEKYGLSWTDTRLQFPYLKMNHHTIVFYVNTSIILLLWLFLNSNKNIIRVLFGLLLILQFLYIFFNGARVGILSSFMILIISAFSYQNNPAVKKIITISFWGGLLLFSTLYYTNIRIKYIVDNSIKEVKNIVTSSQKNNIKVEGNIGVRVDSYLKSIPIIKDHFWKGSAFLEYESLIDTYYSINYPTETVVYPPNQWIKLAINLGVPIMICFMICFFLPLFTFKNYKHFIILSYYCIVFVYFNTEAPMHSKLIFPFLIVITPLLLKTSSYIVSNKLYFNPNSV
jgi:hypothetical protein